MKKYSIDEQKEILLLLLDLIKLYKKQEQANDIMAKIFMELGLGNKNVGQYFTPTPVSDMIIQGIDNEKDIEKDIKKNGYTTFNDPACGSGGLILSLAREIQEKGYSTCRNLYVEAWDIDILCTYMTFLQLSMYDIPAKIINGDALTFKKNFVLYTPAYYIFEQLKNKNKLTVSICNYCKKEIISGEIYTSEISSNKKLCSHCYSIEKKLLLMKELMDMK